MNYYLRRPYPFGLYINVNRGRQTFIMKNVSYLLLFLYKFFKWCWNYRLNLINEDKTLYPDQWKIYSLIFLFLFRFLIFFRMQSTQRWRQFNDANSLNVNVSSISLFLWKCFWWWTVRFRISMKIHQTSDTITFHFLTLLFIKQFFNYLVLCVLMRRWS